MGWGESEYTVVGENKILTVSYGTFSCTLEGFDEPFSTMKAIAEYFRDLAADDRYFGAEPPQPDTEMLHQIAERTIQRRVAAELAENGVILRQETPVEQPEPETPALAVEVAKEPAVQTEAPAPTASVMDAVADVPAAPQRTPVRAEELHSTPPASPIAAAAAPASAGNTVAEKLQRIRAVVAREAAAPAPYSEDQHADELGSDGFDEDAPAASALFDTPIDAGYGDFDGGLNGDLDGDLDGDLEGELEEAAIDTAAMAEDATPEDLKENDVADDAVDDIPAVDTEVDAPEADVSEVVSENASTPDMSDPTELEAGVTEAEVDATEDAPAAVEAEVVEDTPDEIGMDETGMEEAETPVAEGAIEDMAATSAQEETSVSELPAEGDSEAEAIEADEAEDTETGQAPSPLRTKPRRRIIVQKISRSEMDAAQAAKEAELPPELEAELMAELAEVEAEAIDETPADAASVSDTADAEQDAEDDASDDILARLTEDAKASEQKVEAETEAKVEDASAATADDYVLSQLLGDTLTGGADKAEPQQPTAETAPTQEDAASEDVADIAEDAAIEPEAAEGDADDADMVPARKSFAAEAEDDAIERLMNTTSSRLNNDESSVRRASIAHLKAAVAATKADASIVEANEKREEEELGQYRDDLARVVRPSRPAAATGRGERPAPLVLVSEQRIDRPEEAPEAAAASADVRPRRITRGNLALQEEMEEQFDEADGNAFGEEEGQITFPEYAAKAGALELPELLEAAAAHYIQIEGAEHFTRPMLMRKLATIQGPDAPSREDGLRAFGTLLRTGKIVKTDNGKFVLSKNSQFA